MSDRPSDSVVTPADIVGQMAGEYRLRRKLGEGGYGALPSSATPAVVAESNDVRRTRLMITSEAPGASISIDGGPPAPSPLIREVSPGKHQVEVTAEGFYPDRRELTAMAGDLIPEVVGLRERPARLSIAAPSGAEIYINGAFASHGGPQVVLELPSGSHRLAVAESGHKVVLRALELERGKAETVRVDLAPTGQRKAAHVLFIAGSGALAAGVVLGTLAILAESRAQDFLAQKERGSVSAGPRSIRRRARRTRAVPHRHRGQSRLVRGTLHHRLLSPPARPASLGGHQSTAGRPDPPHGARRFGIDTIRSIRGAQRFRGRAARNVLTDSLDDLRRLRHRRRASASLEPIFSARARAVGWLWSPRVPESGEPEQFVAPPRRAQSRCLRRRPRVIAAGLQQALFWRVLWRNPVSTSGSHNGYPKAWSWRCLPSFYDGAGIVMFRPKTTLWRDHGPFTTGAAPAGVSDVWAGYCAPRAPSRAPVSVPVAPHGVQNPQ